MEQRDSLRLLRSEAGLTQMELASALHVNFSTVSRWENHGIRPNMMASLALIELAKKHHVSSACLDLLNKSLSGSRANDRKEKELAKKVTESMKIERREFLTSEQLKMTIDNLDVGIIAQRIYPASPDRTDLFYYNAYFARIFGYELEEFAKKSRDNPYFAIVPESLDGYLLQLKRLLSKKIRLEEFQSRVQGIKRDGSLIWLDVKAISLKDFSYGQELFTSCRDVTEKVEAQRKYREELAYRDVSLAIYYASLHCDLSANKVLRHRDETRLIGHPLVSESADRMICEIAEATPEGEGREKFLSLFRREALMASFSQNIFTGRLNLFNNVGRLWLRIEYFLLKNPDSGHVEALLYAFDIQNQILSERMLNIISQRFFDYVGSIDVKTGNYRGYYYSQKYRKLAELVEGHYPTICKQQMRLRCAGNAEAEIASLDLKLVLRKLEESAFYSAIIHVEDEFGKVRAIKTTFTYLDEMRQHIIVAQSDVQKVYEVFNIMWNKDAFDIALAPQKSRE